MNNAIKLAAAAAFALGVGQAWGATITDSGVTAYYGSDSHNAGDVIGGSTYDISKATIERAGNSLTITIFTNFAGRAGANPTWGVNRKGIGYGDVFLSDTWNAAGSSTDHYVNDNANTGTVWDYGFSLDNRWSNSGGTFKLYALNGATNAANIYNSDSFMTCGAACNYRNGQETAVNTTSSTVQYTGLSGVWNVNNSASNPSLTFKINLSGSELLDYTSFAMHWGETCQNDVIEGLAMNVHIPLPGTALLLAVGLGALGAARRRRGGAALPPAAAA